MSRGTEGEQLFQEIMQNRNYKVIDTTNNSSFWGKDIDFIVTSPITGKTKTFEVKWDYKINKTGNLYLEIINGNSEGGTGWYEFCKADYIAYGDAVNRTFYIIPLLELKKKVEKLPKEVAQCGNESLGYLIPLTAIKDIYTIL